MGKTPEQVQKFKDTFKESLLDAGLSPKLAEEIASVASKIKALEKALGLYEKDPNAWDRAFSLVDEMAEKYANENGFTPEQREALATSIEELLYKEGLRRANITTFYVLFATRNKWQGYRDWETDRKSVV